MAVAGDFCTLIETGLRSKMCSGKGKVPRARPFSLRCRDMAHLPVAIDAVPNPGGSGEAICPEFARFHRHRGIPSIVVCTWAATEARNSRR
jgi:hypothetical protein